MSSSGPATPEVLPAELLAAISAVQGGRVVLITGAGCSLEPPTNLPLASQCSREVHRRLVDDMILNSADCVNPEDLSCVADAVFLKLHSQSELVHRLPIDDFRLAEPNEGHLLAAAMLRERALNCIVTLNFDLAMTSALTYVGARDVHVIARPQDHGNLGVTNVIYLHRNVDADPEDWTLRSATLDNDWKDGWQHVIVQSVVVSPVTVFVGLGSSAAVFVDSTRRIRNALPDTVDMFFVNPGKREESTFFDQLSLPSDSYIPMAWVSFMRLLALRVVEEHKIAIEQACNDLLATEGWDVEDTQDLCLSLANLGLLGLGKLRARWSLNDAGYATRNSVQVEWIADLLLAVGLIERTSGTKAMFFDDGVVEFRKEATVLTRLVIAHGRGYRTWASLEAELGQYLYRHHHHGSRPRRALISGVLGARAGEFAPPPNIVIDQASDDIVTGDSELEIYDAMELRLTPRLIQNLIR